MPAKPTTQQPCCSTQTTIAKTAANIGRKRQGSGADEKLAKKVRHHAGRDGNEEDDKEEGDDEEEGEEEGEEEEPAMSAARASVATRSCAAQRYVS